MNKITGDDSMPTNADNDKINASQDLPDSEADFKQMEPETVIVDLPDVEDIPGQEHVKVMPMGELADITISSDDEEGKGIPGLDDEEDDDDDLASDTSVDVSREENNLLEQSGTAIPDDQQLKQAELDNTDDDGEPLNEGSLSSSRSGSDLDIPGAEADDASEEIGEEDEENNDYSQPDAEK